MQTNSAARSLYLKIMCMKCKCPALLNNRAVSICEYNLEPMKCCLDCENFNYIKDRIYHKKEKDGVVDSIRALLGNRSQENMCLLRLLLKVFNIF